MILDITSCIAELEDQRTRVRLMCDHSMENIQRLKAAYFQNADEMQKLQDKFQALFMMMEESDEKARKLLHKMDVLYDKFKKLENFSFTVN